MELPIRIIITLFVAVTVAAAIITFSKGIISQSERDIGDLGDDQDVTDEDKIITLAYFDETQIASLAVECYKMGYEELTSMLCFYVIDESGSSTVDPVQVATMIRSSEELQSDVNIDLGGYTGTEYSIRISYDPSSDTIQIRR